MSADYRQTTAKRPPSTPISAKHLPNVRYQCLLMTVDHRQTLAKRLPNVRLMSAANLCR
jgi:hypothetical protein